ncbi:hypothetical protein H4J68_05930 [Colwellia sp. MB3u-28]|nr:hypothetical protein [Colwellia sp. MB02u-7]MBA6234665.1 hypothetical protein [Colwellia sp. MB02u-11]MBA6255528.1 hypothetical protein [Colwellia sp. MB3u-28]MBA6261668.1 hypothetical protein [Colwellia sp. MB3u-41]MBA6301219.1 hypothetical protein [Colwellia sp. MB3u-22]MBA6305296.1 hypothetical protein [Colwellia sp. MB02u-14]MBA6313045.1 hypothetical protein [Colwellia sp. MB3u-64]
MDGLKEDRQELICSSVAIALMECLEINALDYCQYALREAFYINNLKT